MKLISEINRARELAGMKPLSEAQETTLSEAQSNDQYPEFEEYVDDLTEYYDDEKPEWLEDNAKPGKDNMYSAADLKKAQKAIAAKFLASSEAGKLPKAKEWAIGVLVGYDYDAHN